MVQLPRVRPRTGVEVRGQTAETTRGRHFQMRDMKGTLLKEMARGSTCSRTTGGHCALMKQVVQNR